MQTTYAGLSRRHLHQSQRALVAAKMANLKVGRPDKTIPQNCGITSVENAATLLNVSSRSVESAKHVLANGSKALIDAVEAMQVKVSMADKLCKKKPATCFVVAGLACGMSPPTETSTMS